MTDRICSVESCPKAAYTRGWCNAHYIRWQRHGDPLGGSAARDGRQGCAVAGCELDHYARGWCFRHYARVRRTGDPGPAEIQPYGQSCQVDGCENPHRAEGYCNLHYLRWRSHGDPVNLPEPTVYVGEEHPGWKGDEVGYGRVHTRIVGAKGSASTHRCCDCGGPAEDWAYLHGAPDERRDDQGRLYSTDPDFYVPLCRSCHKVFDNAMR